MRALVYDLRTGAVLATQNLTQSTSNARLFTATLQAPADSVRNGRSIVSIASVYTDSSYSTISQDTLGIEVLYQRHPSTYLTAGGRPARITVTLRPSVSKIR